MYNYILNISRKLGFQKNLYTFELIVNGNYKIKIFIKSAHNIWNIIYFYEGEYLYFCTFVVIKNITKSFTIYTIIVNTHTKKNDNQQPVLVHCRTKVSPKHFQGVHFIVMKKQSHKYSFELSKNDEI